MRWNAGGLISFICCCSPLAPHSFTSDPQCLHSLVSWAHHHGGACRSCPDLKEVLEGRGWGSVQAAWGCVDGHRYIMDTQRTPAAQPFSMNSCSGRANGEGGVSWEEEEEGRSGNVRTASGSVSTLAQHSPAAVLSQSPADWTCNPEGETATAVTGVSNDQSWRARENWSLRFKWLVARNPQSSDTTSSYSHRYYTTLHRSLIDSKSVLCLLIYLGFVVILFSLLQQGHHVLMSLQQWLQRRVHVLKWSLHERIDMFTKKHSIQDIRS